MNDLIHLMMMMLLLILSYDRPIYKRPLNYLKQHQFNLIPDQLQIINHQLNKNLTNT